MNKKPKYTITALDKKGKTIPTKLTKRRLANGEFITAILSKNLKLIIRETAREDE